MPWQKWTASDSTLEGLGPRIQGEGGVGWGAEVAHGWGPRPPTTPALSTLRPAANDGWMGRLGGGWGDGENGVQSLRPPMTPTLDKESTGRHASVRQSWHWGALRTAGGSGKSLHHMLRQLGVCGAGAHCLPGLRQSAGLVGRIKSEHQLPLAFSEGGWLRKLQSWYSFNLLRRLPSEGYKTI